MTQASVNAVATNPRGATPVDSSVGVDCVLFGARDEILIVQADSTEPLLIALAKPSVLEARWWFAPIDSRSICCQSNVGNKPYELITDRNDPNYGAIVALGGTTPDGGIIGGIVNGVLVMGGIVPVSAAPEATNLTIRWSARRGEASGGGGALGFEDWTISAVNSAGEYILDKGSTIIGGGAAKMGFVAFTDVAGYVLAPRSDTYVFSERQFSERGLLAFGCWAESDGRLWWMDQDKVLNVYDGSGARPIECPIRNLTIDLMDDAVRDRCQMAVDDRYGEVIFTYPLRVTSGEPVFRSIVYNYRENIWYPWSLPFIHFARGVPGLRRLAVDDAGLLYRLDLEEALDLSLVTDGDDLNPSGPPDPPGVPGVDYSPSDPEQLLLYSWYITTNWFAPGPLETIAMRDVLLNIASAGLLLPDGTPQYVDTITSRFISRPEHVSTNAQDFVDDEDLLASFLKRNHRIGGKMIRMVLRSESCRSLVRIGEVTIAGPDISSRQ